MRSRVLSVIGASFLLPMAVVAASDQGLQLAQPQQLFPADLLQISSTEAFSKYVMLVDKKERQLMVFERDDETIKLIESIPADIGKNDGDKVRENDHRTPEGIYFFQQKKSPPEIPFSLYGKMAFTTDYPNIFDRRLKKTGHGIWLHSIPESVPLTRGSRGCVVIRNEALERIEKYIQFRQTPIIIFDKIDYVTKAEHDRRRKELTQWVENWRQAWQSQDVDRYLEFYSDDFSAPGFKRFRSWERHKRRLASNYEEIRVTLSQPYFLLHKDQLIVKTLQKYESDQHTDYGVKVLHAVRTDQGYRIIREDWTPADERGSESEPLSMVHPASLSERPGVASPQLTN